MKMVNMCLTEVILIQSNAANNSHQQNSRALHAFVPDKSFGQLLDTSLKYFTFLKTFDSEFLYIEVWFIDQNFNSLKVEDKINITTVIN